MADTITRRECPKHGTAGIYSLGCGLCHESRPLPVVTRTYVAVDALEEFFVDSPLTLREVRGAIEAIRVPS